MLQRVDRIQRRVILVAKRDVVGSRLASLLRRDRGGERDED
jgi:hypothetical protein